MKRLRTVFMGTPDFAVPCLEKLTEISEVVGVVTQPDKPRGRGKKLTPSPVNSIERYSAPSTPILPMMCRIRSFPDTFF